MIYLLATLAALATAPSVRAQPDTDLPQSHPVYPLLDRLEAHGRLQQQLPGVRPYSIRRIASVAKAVAGDPGLLPAEKATLDRFLAAYHDAPRSSPIHTGTVYTFGDTLLTVRVRPLVRQNLTSIGGPAQENFVSQTYLGLGVEGAFHDRFSFTIRHTEAREWGNILRTSPADVRARPLEAVQIKGKTVDFRESRFQLRANLPWFDLDFGKQAFDWGPGRAGNLSLHHAAPSFLYARLELAYKALSFQHLIGALRPSPEAIHLGTTTTSNGHRRTIPADKRLVTHRLELALSRRVRVGIHETVIYGDRAFEPAYALPVSVLIGAQSYVGDTDNLTFGIDLVAQASESLQLYGALFFDDLQKFTPGAFSNQFGVQIGSYWVAPLGIRSTDLRVEYARIEPYTYAHNFDINAYTHFRAPLGHPLGPNADSLMLTLQWWAASAVRFTLESSFSRAGDNYYASGELVNVGGDPAQGRRPSDVPERSFLAGDLTRTYRLTAGLLIEPTAALRLSASYRHTRTRVDLVTTGRQPATSSHTLVLSTEFNAF